MTGSQGRLRSAVSGIAGLVLLAGCSTDGQDAIPPATPSGPSSTGVSRTASPSTSPERGHDGPTFAVHVMYVHGGPGAELVARRARVPMRGNPILNALDLAAQPPGGPLRAVVPPDAFSLAGFDGIGKRGSFWVEVAHERFGESRLGMSQGEARVALRAVICTVQSLGGNQPASGHQPVRVYPPGGGHPLRQLFGTPVPQAHHHRVDVNCPVSHAPR